MRGQQVTLIPTLRQETDQTTNLSKENQWAVVNTLEGFLYTWNATNIKYKADDADERQIGEGVYSSLLLVEASIVSSHSTDFLLKMEKNESQKLRKRQ